MLTKLSEVAKYKQNFDKFINHTYKIVNQYRAMRTLKENLHLQEAVLHIDFSENYSLKYGAEVQSFHFGGSRQQVSLHTAVIYTHDFATGSVAPTSMCTISRCLRHDAPAVWAHLITIIDETTKRNPFIDTIHILSDSPTSQYRNKFIFYLISQLKNDFAQIEKVTWNYLEAGHGKGAPDGVGAVMKRTADRIVNFGQDAGTFEQFLDILSTKVENIVIKCVEEVDITKREKMFPKQIKTFRGTFSTYQVLWNKHVTTRWRIQQSEGHELFS